MVRTRARIILLLVLLLSLSGCLSGCALCELGGLFSEHGVDHCYQWAAVKSGDPAGCEKIPGTGFEGENPPKDKCYVLLAAKKEDPDLCLKTEGVFYGYDRLDCYDVMGEKGVAADACSGHAYEEECRTHIAEAGPTPSCGEGWAWDGERCTRTEREPPADRVMDEATRSIDALRDEALRDARGDREADEQEAERDTRRSPLTENGAARPETPEEDQESAPEPEVTEKLEVIEQVFATVDKNKQPTPEQEKKTRLSELVKDLPPEDRSVVIRTFIKERRKRDEMTIKEQEELIEDIKQEYSFNKLMDEKANTLKAETVDKLTEKVNELVEEKKQSAWDWFKEKTYGWVKGRTPDKYKSAAALAEKKYNAAVKKYNAALASYKKGKDYFDRAKAAYQEIKQVMDNVRRLQEKVKSGRITEGRAKVLKGGVLLGKGLEYSTRYIPVFGETISTVTAGTFQATMRFAEKRAERTTKLDACIEDPENCDPNGISAY